ncbi:hypothetical protein [Sphaerisporangium corydalis]|uniref:Secreted protein n=1 Tax=Sphaerisporangium corydalis TaxID=1441875 RepID=A0ABV9ECR3_9ACTN|nr:hypothetical protein [Sphaerisporangium corydalis]
MTSGTATAFKLLVATLAFAGAYFGVTTTRSAAEPDHGTTLVAGTPVRTVVLSARSMPVEARHIPQAGMVTVAAATATASCGRTYHAQAVIDPGPSGDPVVYGWRLQRWSVSAHEWRSYLFSGTDGFMGAQRTVEWYPRVVDNPGWYRVELTVAGKGGVLSEKFQITC